MSRKTNRKSVEKKTAKPSKEPTALPAKARTAEPKDASVDQRVSATLTTAAAPLAPPASTEERIIKRRKPDSEQKTEILKVLVTRDERARLQAASDAARLTLSTWIRISEVGEWSRSFKSAMTRATRGIRGMHDEICAAETAKLRVSEKQLVGLQFVVDLMSESLDRIAPLRRTAMLDRFEARLVALENALDELDNALENHLLAERVFELYDDVAGRMRAAK